MWCGLRHVAQVSAWELASLFLLLLWMIPLEKAKRMLTCRLKGLFCVRISEGLVSFSSSWGKLLSLGLPSLGAFGSEVPQLCAGGRPLLQGRALQRAEAKAQDSALEMLRNPWLQRQLTQALLVIHDTDAPRETWSNQGIYPRIEMSCSSVAEGTVGPLKSGPRT